MEESRMPATSTAASTTARMVPRARRPSAVVGGFTSGHALQPRLGAELRLDELGRLRQLVRRDLAGLESVEAAEGVDHLLDDLGALQPRLAAERIDALGRARDTLVAELLAADAQHLHHLLAVHVVAHRDVVQHGAAAQALLRGAPDLARRTRDVVERHIGGLDAERAQ